MVDCQQTLGYRIAETDESARMKEISEKQNGRYCSNTSTEVFD